MPKTAKQKSVFGAARIISGSIFLSRILGFVRDILCAGFFGWVWDAFIFAFTIPNLFRRLFGEGALSAAFIPTFSHYLENKPRPDTLRFISAVITSLVTILSLMAGLIILGTFILPAVLPTVLPATYPAEFTLFFAKLLRILIPYLPIICLVALLGALLNTLKHFTMPALASVVLNISWIAGFFIGMR
ncbi:MAG: murein biosynthesis integral membrane protein MurJ, partial [Planctomycetes bacterium]|nr:murein biosynthesis integral membrane protein MurJ [Planctomycetota bacterium]